MSYLENGICNFKLIGRSKIHKNGVNIISITFFKLPKVYKNFYIYINGLKNWIKILEELKSNFIIRLFIDQNIYDDQNIMKIINSSKYIEPVLFICADYVLDKYHIDLFATLIRFFPVFNFKNNDAFSILSADIDLHFKNEQHVIFYKYILSNYKNINEITISSTNIYDYYFGNFEPYIQAGLLFIPNKTKFNKNIFIDFFQIEDKLKYFNKYIDKADKGLFKNKLKGDFFKTIKDSQFSFGIDELFLNQFLKKKTMNNLDVVILQNFNYILYYLIFYNKKNSNEIIINNKNYSKEFEESIYKITKKKISLINYFEQVDKILYIDDSYIKVCFNHKYKNCYDDIYLEEKVIKNLELRNVLNNFKNKIPKDSSIYQILNSGLLKLDKFAYFLNLKFKRDSNKNFKFQSFNVIYKTKK